MNFQALANYFSKLEQTSSRNEMTDILADLLAKTDVGEIEPVCYLCLGGLAPRYRKVDFNVAEKLLVRSLSRAFGLTEDETLAGYKKIGDLGDLVTKLSAGRRVKKQLTVKEVFSCLEEIASASGTGSVERKLKLLADLMVSIDGQSGKYLVRIVLGRLRLGFSDVTLLDALSVMLKGDKSARTEIERAYNVRADIGQVVRLVKQGGLKGLKEVCLTPGIPVRAALAERLPSVEKIVEKIGSKGVLEPKIDGFRVQIHFDRDQHIAEVKREAGLFNENIGDEPLVRVFSRGLEDMTHMFPDLVKEVSQLSGVRSVIFDGEAAGVDLATGRLVPFQETVKRKRKHGVREKADELPLVVYLFDLLYCDGKSLLEVPYYQRRKKLVSVVGKGRKQLRVVEQQPLKSVTQLRRLFDKYFSQGLEGVMVKKIDSIYQAGGRNFNWVKLKKTTEEGLTDTVDGVVLGYYRGRGKRNVFGLGAFLVGVRGAEDHWVTLAKIGTGLTDDQWRQMYQLCQPLVSELKPTDYKVHKNLTPDVWVAPGVIVEVKADEITRSPVHTCSYNNQQKTGLAMRFPRLVSFRKKPVSEVDTEKMVRKMYQEQFREGKCERGK